MDAPLIALLELNLGPLAPEHPIEIIVGIVLVLLLTWGCAKFIVPRFEDMYHERSEAVQGGIERAEKAQAEARAALEQYRAQLAGAREEAARIREDAKSQGAQILTEMREQAASEADRISARARLQISAEREQAVTELRTQIGGLATDLAGRIVGESLDDDARVSATVDRFIADLAKEPAAGERAGARAVDPS